MTIVLKYVEHRGMARYEDGYKYCSHCGVFFRVPEDWRNCPSCGRLLRSNPRTKKRKRYSTVGGE